MTVIVDYGVGNLFSLSCSLAAIGETGVVSSSKELLARADRIILPGVGAFADAMEKLTSSGLSESVCAAAARGVPLLGICLGMQLLFETSFEYGTHPGLKLIEGCVKSIPVPETLKIPHMGWNALSFGKEKHPLFRYVSEGEYVYFVHSYAAADCEKALIAQTEYGVPVTAAVAKKNVLGCQFHPEKSGAAGLDILKAFCEFRKGDL